METFEILDGFASVRSNRRVQRHGRNLFLALAGVTVALLAAGLATRWWPSFSGALVLVAVLTGYAASIAGQRYRHSRPNEGVDLQPGRIEVADDALTIVHPMLRDPLVTPIADVCCFAVDVAGGPFTYAVPRERFPIAREPGLGYRLWEPRFLLSSEAVEHGRQNVVLLHLSLDDPVRPTMPNLALLFRQPVAVTAAVGPHDSEVPRAFWALAANRRSERAQAEERNRTWEAVEVPGLYVQVADPHPLRLALRERGVREGVEADDVPGAPPHLPLPPPGTT
jgi:hypothetical protein